MEDVVSYVTAIIILQGAAWSSAKAPWHGRPRWPVKVPNHSKGVPQSQPTSLAPPAVQYHPIWDRYATVPTHHHRNFAICWTVREEASKNEKKKKKRNARNSVRVGGAHDETPARRRHIHFPTQFHSEHHINRLYHVHMAAKSSFGFLRAPAGLEPAWDLPTRTPPLSLTLFLSFKFACAGKGDSDALRSF